MAENETNQKTHEHRIFELYVDQLTGESQELDEVLIVRLKWFSEDVQKVSERLAENPEDALRLVHGLSSLMQRLDSDAGASDRARESVSSARRWALLIPDAKVHQ